MVDAEVALMDVLVEAGADGNKVVGLGQAAVRVAYWGILARRSSGLPA